MSKVSRKCPICDGDFIVVMVHEGNNLAWPECWKCGFAGRTPEDKETMAIDLNLNSHMDGAQIFKEAVSAWTEYLTLLDEENIETIKEDN
jgi:Zn ribbon nucleic-acid-binding protein